HGLEREAAGPGRDGCETTLVVEPDGLVAPGDAGYEIPLQADRLPADGHRVRAGRLDPPLVGRRAGDGAQPVRTAVRLPVADEHHLDRERRVSGHGEEAVRKRDL